MCSNIIARMNHDGGVGLANERLLQRAIKGSAFTPAARIPQPAGMDTDVAVTAGGIR